MEVEIVNRKKGSRIIQQKGGPGGQAHIADNRANPVQGLMMNRDVAQRVIQRTGEANGKFCYDPYSSDVNFRVPYTPNTIHFTKYKAGSEIRSAGFNGCYMMAFRFNEDKKIDVEKMFAKPVQDLDYDAVYIAHVANDDEGKFALLDAETRRLIFIDSIFRPYRNESIENSYIPKDWSDKTFSSGSQAGIDRFTGGMKLGEKGWEGKVYKQEKIAESTKIRIIGGVPEVVADNDLNEEETMTVGEAIAAGSISESHIHEYKLYKWKNKKIADRDYSGEMMKIQTLATKAYIYAWVIKKIKTEKGDGPLNPDERAKVDRAEACLQEIGRNCPDAILLALKELVNSSREPEITPILKGSLSAKQYKLDIAEICNFLMRLSPFGII
jgi:hypothetical protein